MGFFGYVDTIAYTVMTLTLCYTIFLTYRSKEHGRGTTQWPAVIALVGWFIFLGSNKFESTIGSSLATVL